MSADDPLVLGFRVAGPAEGPRRRAPRRPDAVKRQVSVPSEVWQRLEAAAGQLGITPNDLLVRLAGSGMERAERLGRTKLLAAERWAAFTAAESAHDRDSAVPSIDELVAAAEAYSDE